ncbi:MAG TPA: cytochrome c biogenesis protein CcsA [Candidatus Angelobacter sp.]
MNSKLYPLLVGLVLVLLSYGTYLALTNGVSKTTFSFVRVEASDSPVTLPVVSTENFVPGEPARIDSEESHVQETQTIVAVPDATHVTVARLDHPHDGAVIGTEGGPQGFTIVDWTPLSRMLNAPAPTESTMGEVQRIFYYHVPAATCAYTLFFINFIASILYLWKRSAKADMWAAISAEVGLVFSTVVLITGPIWGRVAWNTWWAWEPRLTTFLILWLLYVSYLVLRRSAEAGSSSVLAAALAVFAFLDVPFSYMANRFRGHHPPPITLEDPRMKFALMINMLAFLAFAGLIVWFRYQLEKTDRQIAAIHIERATRGVMISMAFPAIFFFQVRQNLNPVHYLYAAYIAAWVIYIGYLLLLMRKVARLRREEEELLDS